jgi:hypothetical protein
MKLRGCAASMKKLTRAHKQDRNQCTTTTLPASQPATTYRHSFSVGNLAIGLPTGPGAGGGGGGITQNITYYTTSEVKKKKIASNFLQAPNSCGGSPFEDIAMIDHLVLDTLSVLHSGVRTGLQGVRMPRARRRTGKWVTLVKLSENPPLYNTYVLNWMLLIFWGGSFSTYLLCNLDIVQAGLA